MLAPEFAELLQPNINLLQCGWLDRVESSPAVYLHRSKSVVPQYTQVLRDGRLGNPELSSDSLGNDASRLRAVGKQLEDASPYRITEDVQCVHSAII